MKIIILGAGEVGGTLAANLVSDSNDITVVDTNRTRLAELQDKYDLSGVHGHAAHPQTLIDADIENTDTLIAVTSSDECNMAACHLAYSLFNTPTKIARIRSEAYLNFKDRLFVKSSEKARIQSEQSDTDGDSDRSADSNIVKGFLVDHTIAPEQLVTDYICRLIAYPGALQVLQFAEGKVSLVGMKAYYGGSLVGNAISTLRDHMPNIDSRVAAIFRQGKAIVPRGTTIIEADDEVFFLADTLHIRAVMSEMQKLEKFNNNIIIAGGGNIGLRLAKKLQHQHDVKLIEKFEKRAQELSEELDSATVYHGDASNYQLLRDLNIDQTDVFISVTNDDEANIMSALLAKRSGAKKVMSLIQNEAYVDIVQDTNIDIAISPQQITISALLSKVRSGDTRTVHSLRRGVAEAIEIQVHGQKESSRVIGKKVVDVPLPPGTIIGAIVRDDQVLMAHDKTVIENKDRLIIFFIDKSNIPKVEKLLRGGFFFV